MKILFLEDDPARIALARRAFIGHNIIFCETAAEAIKLLQSSPRFDLASLDHDLGGQQMCESDGNSGYAVACAIEAMGVDAAPILTIVHSLNPAGAERMMHALRNVWHCRAPFGSVGYWIAAGIEQRKDIP